jgi:hypothetical protein
MSFVLEHPHFRLDIDSEPPPGAKVEVVHYNPLAFIHETAEEIHPVGLLIGEIVADLPDDTVKLNIREQYREGSVTIYTRGVLIEEMDDFAKPFDELVNRHDGPICIFESDRRFVPQVGQRIKGREVFHLLHDGDIVLPINP